MSTADHVPAASPDWGVRPVQRARGEHLSSFHDSQEDQRRLTAAFAASALAAGERIVYAASGHEAEATLQALAERGVDGGEAVRSGQLTTLSFAELPRSAAGVLDLGAVLACYQAEADRTRAGGYPAMRLAVEMTALVDALGCAEEVVRWETEVGPLFDALGVTSLCQYVGPPFDPHARERIEAAHDAQAVDDGTAPPATFETTATGDLRVTGELDLTTIASFGRALAARAAVRPRLQVDLSAVAFTDVRGLRTIFEVAQELPPDSKLSLVNMRVEHRRLLELLGWHDRRIEVEPA